MGTSKTYAMKPRKFKRRDKTVARRRGQGRTLTRWGPRLAEAGEDGEQGNQVDAQLSGSLSGCLCRQSRRDVLVTDVVSVFHMTEMKMCFASRGVRSSVGGFSSICH
jgi:hypothetical protein